MATVLNFITPIAIALALIAGYMVAAPTPAAAQMLDAGTGVSLDLDTSVLDADMNATTSVTTEENSDTAVSTGSRTILRSSLGAETETAPATAAAVATDADLNAYASAAMRADERIEAVTFNEDNVEVRYDVHGRLLGFIPVTMTTQVEVASDGTVAVSYPWYRFLVATDADADIESELASQVDSSATFTASAKAALVDEIRAALPEASVSASADAAVR